MEIPNNFQHLANLLKGQTFKHISSLTDMIGADAKGFFDNVSVDEIKVESTFPRYIPIVRERVSVKKHDYNITTHIVFWLDDGEPYIYTPPPTIEHNRLGSKVKKLTRDEYLMIPHNCSAFDLLTLREGYCHHDDLDILELKITRHRK